MWASLRVEGHLDFSLISEKAKYFFKCLGTMGTPHTVNCLFTDFAFFFSIGLSYFIDL